MKTRVMMMTKNKQKEDFLELWEMGMKFFKVDNPSWKFRFCPKSSMTISFSDLVKMECWACNEYILNDGNCDCI